MFTLGEIIDLAVRVEKNGEKIYRDAMNKISDPALISLLKWLADQEVEHEKWFHDLKNRLNSDAKDPRLEEMGRNILQGILGDQGFSLEDVDFTHMDQIKALLETAIEFERDTILFFEMLQAFIEDVKALSGLDEIIQEEKSHVQALQEALEKGVSPAA